LQADWFEQVAKVALGKPFVESVSWGNFCDANATIPGAGLLDDMLKPKPALERVKLLKASYFRRDKKA
jgi:hypothetical protein